MLASVQELLFAAQRHVYAVGAFNVYNLEGVCAVVRAAEGECSPVILQIHPAPIRVVGKPLAALCLVAARMSQVPVGVHLDHSTSAADIRGALELGVPSIMADGSHLPYPENVAFAREMAAIAHASGAIAEVELGRLTGTEDGLTVSERNAKLTDPAQATDFIRETGADSLAVCIGNVHGHYHSEPNLDLERLSRIRNAVDVPLVLHGASGLPASVVRRAIGLGVCKFNVNTELREAFLAVLSSSASSGRKSDLLDVMKDGIAAMQSVACSKIRDFGSNGKCSFAA
jgi:tagatose 1,6-diphosphate aldolase GatY/KbaY